MIPFLAEQPILLLALLLLLGALLGQVKVGRVAIGPAAVLFAAIAVSAVGVANDVVLEIPETVGILGLVLFTYTIGIVSGPSFFASLRRGWPVMLSVVATFVVVAGLAVLVGRSLGLSSSVVAGTFAGGLTNTPALAAATELAEDPAGPTIGYSIAYLWGVVGMLLAAAWSLRHRGDEAPPSEPLVNQTVRTERAAGMLLSDIEDRYDHRLTFSRLKHGHFASPTVVADDDDRLGPNDLVTVVGPRDLVDRVTAELGHPSTHDIVGGREELDFRRVTVSRSTLAGRSVGALDLEGRFGAHISRVRRADVDLVATRDFRLQMGDRVRVTAPVARMADVGRYLGDSDRGMSDINPSGFALGLSLGLLVGLIHIPLPGGGFALGSAAGTLLAGLVFGRLGRVGPVVTSMSNGAAQSLSYFGMITFLAYAGTRAGERITEAVSSDVGWKVAVLGFVVTTAAAVLLLLAGRLFHGMGGTEHAGMLAGAQTQPAILAFADERTGFDTRVGLGYVLVYPVAMIIKIVIVQVLVGIG